MASKPVIIVLPTIFQRKTIIYRPATLTKIVDGQANILCNFAFKVLMLRLLEIHGEKISWNLGNRTQMDPPNHENLKHTNAR